MDFLEDRDSAQPKGPEPILTCVQCLAEYKESENAGDLIQPRVNTYLLAIIGTR